MPQPDRVRLPQHRLATQADLRARKDQRGGRLLAAIFVHLVLNEEGVKVDELLPSTTR